MKYLLLPFAVLSLVAFSSCTKKSTTVSGKIQVAPLIEHLPVQPTAVIYLIARPAGQTSGMPLAVKRFTPPFNFPIEFTLSAQDVMMPGTPFEGGLELSIRLAQSGSATPVSAGDFEGEVVSGPVTVGSKDVELRLSKVKQ